MKNSLSPKKISSNQLISDFYSKNVTFTKFLPKSVRVISVIATLRFPYTLLRTSVEKREIHCHVNFFRQINLYLVKFFSKTLIWRNFCEKTLAVQCVKEIYSHIWQKFRESNVFNKEATKELISRKFFSEREFPWN